MKMKVFWIGAAWALSALVCPQAADKVVYDHLETGFQFSYPREWTLKKNRDHITLSFTAGEANRPAILEVYGATFTGEIPTWQAVQVNAAKDLKREVVRQWQEEILTVPMLMARTHWTSKDVEYTSDNALVYANTRRKLLFRLEARTDDFEAADRAFRDVLQSLKMIDGHLPKPFDPSKPQSENLRRPDTDGKSGVWTRERPKDTAPVKGDQVVQLPAGNLPMLARFAGAWKAQPSDTAVVLTHPDVTGEVKMRAFSALESDPPGKSLLKASAASLVLFSKVPTRDEKGPLPNRAGAGYAMIWRAGANDAGPLFSFDAVVSSGDYYLLLSWTGADARAAQKCRDRLMELVNSLSVEPKPAGGL